MFYWVTAFFYPTVWFFGTPNLILWTWKLQFLAHSLPRNHSAPMCIYTILFVGRIQYTIARHLSSSDPTSISAQLFLCVISNVVAEWWQKEKGKEDGGSGCGSCEWNQVGGTCEWLHRLAIIMKKENSDFWVILTLAVQRLAGRKYKVPSFEFSFGEMKYGISFSF